MNEWKWEQPDKKLQLKLKETYLYLTRNTGYDFYCGGCSGPISNGDAFLEVDVRLCGHCIAVAHKAMEKENDDE